MTNILREPLFSETEYKERIGRVIRAMAPAKLDVLILHSLPAIHYLSGFQTAALRAYTCLVLCRDGSAALVLERDEKYNAYQSSWVERVETYTRWESPIEATIRAVSKYGLDKATIGLELQGRYLSPDQASQLGSGLAPSRIVDATGIVPQCMLIKSLAEQSFVERAAALSSAGMRAAIDAVEVGKTDNEIAAAAFLSLISGGSEYMSSDPIVCVGQNSSIPHGHFRNRQVKSGDVVLLEHSACSGRYSAPIMRAVSLGMPNQMVAEMARTCRNGVEAVISAMGPGKTFAAVAAAGKRALSSIGSGMIFHGTYAYSIGVGFPGVSWADCPVEVRDDSSGVLESGMVFHLPISLRYEGQYGVAVSETVAITRDGVRVLTNLDRELVVK